MDKRQYSECINDCLEPSGARDLIFQQFLERSQKPAEIFDLYLRDKYNLFVRSYPSGQSRIFKDYVNPPSVDSIMNFLGIRLGIILLHS